MSLVDVGGMLYPDMYFSGSVSSFTLDAAEEHGASVIVIPKTGTLLKVGWRVASVSSPVLGLKVSLETVADAIGVPVATTDSGKTLYAANAQSAEITNPSAGVRFDAINGSSPGTGISVTKGDLVSVVVRCTAYTSGNATVAYDQYNNLLARFNTTFNVPYWYTYLGGAGAVGSSALMLTLEYDTGFVYTPLGIPAAPALSANTWNSGSNPDRRGLKMTFPFGCKLRGCLVALDTDEDCQIVLYGQDEYTVTTGFPVTIQGNMRRANASTFHWIEFPTEPTLSANAAYRLVVLPLTVTNIGSNLWTPSDDGAVLGMDGLMGGRNFIYTTFNGTPTSGSHTWTDVATQRFPILPIISQIDFPSGSGGGFPILGGSVVR